MPEAAAPTAGDAVRLRQSPDLETLQQQIVNCRRCERLVQWRETVAAEPPLRFHGQTYWARPVPGWGSSDARLLIVGLAPAAHGGNRTGRVFTGDRSGDWLFRSMHGCGFASSPVSLSAGDGLQLRDCYISAACRCAPPQNRPTLQEMANCRPFLLRELALLPHLKVILGLGKIGFDAAFDAARAARLTDVGTRPVFCHGAKAKLSERLTLMGTYHPSQQNTFTGRLTEPMLDAVFEDARRLIEAED